ncbi:MAG: hypothetical protein K1X74_08895 [Pirellulales bacterium]|nr:hypothetical protein [Pirellulales bacterium]
MNADTHHGSTGNVAAARWRWTLAGTILTFLGMALDGCSHRPTAEELGQIIPAPPKVDKFPGMMPVPELDEPQAAVDGSSSTPGAAVPESPPPAEPKQPAAEVPAVPEVPQTGENTP